MNNDQLDGTNNDITQEGNLNLDQNYNSSDSLLNDPGKLPGIDFDAKFDIQAVKGRFGNLLLEGGKGTPSQANQARLYLTKDVSTGKIKLMIQFHTGAAIQLAIQV